MRSKLLVRILRDLGATILGYTLIAALTSLGFNGLLGGRPLYGGAPFDLVAGMLVAMISGLAGGCLAGLIGAERGVINAAFVLLPLAADTTYVLFYFKRGTTPLWFDAMASATLMGFTLLGGFFGERFNLRKTRRRSITPS